MNAQEFIDACNNCRDAQRAAELLRVAVDIAADHERISKIAYKLKELIEQEREQSKTTISQYEEQVKRLSEQVEDLSAELEDKRIELSQLSSLDHYVRRFGVDTMHADETVDKLCAVADKLCAVADNLSTAVISHPVTLENNINEVAVSMADLQKEEKQARKSVESILQGGQSDKKVQQDKPKKVSSAALTKSFERFWAEYPKKKDRKRALNIWLKLAPDNELVSKIIEAVKQQKKSEQWVKDKGQFVPNPSTWLNNELWTDEVATPAVSVESDSVGHSYDLDKLIKHAKDQFKGSD